MKLIKLGKNETITNKTYLKAFSSHKAVMVQHCIGLIVGEIEPFFDKDFEGFSKRLKNESIKIYYGWYCKNNW